MRSGEGELHHIYRSEIISGLGLGRPEPELNAARLVKVGGGGLVVAVVSGLPGDAELVQQSAAVVVVVGILGQEHDRESFLLPLVGDSCEVEVGDRHGLSNEVLGLELGSAAHERGQGQFVDCDVSEVFHCNSPLAIRLPTMKFFREVNPRWNGGI